MKLIHKIAVLDVAVGGVFLLLAFAILFSLTHYLVERELDKHLLAHHRDVIAQLEQRPELAEDLNLLRIQGSMEWIELSPLEHTAEGREGFENLMLLPPNTRAETSESEAYRRYSSIIEADGSRWQLDIYERKAGWQTISYSIITVLLILLIGLMILLYVMHNVALKRILAPFYATVGTLSALDSFEKFDQQFPKSNTYEIDALHTALNRSLAQLKRLYEQQNEFIQNASHELKTPLTIIRQQVDKLLARSENQLRPREYQSLGDIQATIARVTRLNKALLIISRIENKQYQQEEALDLEGITTRVLGDLQVFIEGKQLQPTMSFDHPAIVKGNPDLLYMLLFNILQNAVKFSHPGGRVDVTGTLQKDDRYRLCVSDNGPGIAEKDLHNIFERFHKSYEDWNESPGLGLSIVKSICDISSIRYEVQSGTGKGSSFCFYFPKS